MQVWEFVHNLCTFFSRMSRSLPKPYFLKWDVRGSRRIFGNSKKRSKIKLCNHQNLNIKFHVIILTMLLSVLIVLKDKIVNNASTVERMLCTLAFWKDDYKIFQLYITLKHSCIRYTNKCFIY